jgi:hypothetical protein
MANETASPAAVARPAKPPLKQRLRHELLELLAMFLYLLVPIGLFVLHQAMFKREEGIHVQASGLALINALVLAKVMLVAEDMGLGNRWRERPLIWPILDKSISFAVLFVVVHDVEHGINGLLHGKGFIESIPALGGGGVLGLFAVVLTMTIALIPFFGYREMGRVMGEGKIEALLFKRRGALAPGEPISRTSGT